MSSSSDVNEAVIVHALTWLAVGTLAGILLATLLLVPELGSLLAPLSYGRLMAVHLDVVLYGWCGLPLVGLLFRLCLPRQSAGRLPLWALHAWSGTLLFGIVSWLAGETSGKPFLEWTGIARLLLVANFVWLWCVLAISLVRRWREEPRSVAVGVGATLLAGLAAVPALFYRVTGAASYPPINPDSGGATGGSLLGSTLAVVGIALLIPPALGLDRRGRGRARVVASVAFALHLASFAALDHGDHSHHEAAQILALFSLAAWFPLLVAYLHGFAWPAGARPWLVALLAWGSVLLGSACLMFLPGILEQFKFTNLLVAHAHLAMAGFSSSIVGLVLLALGARAESTRRPMADRGAFLLWHVGCAIYVLVMSFAGIVESVLPYAVFRSHPAIQVLYAARLVAGIAMAWASLRWLAIAVRTSAPMRVATREARAA